MGIHLSKALWRAGLAAALVVGALMALPFGGAARAASGTLTASLTGNNGVAITLNGAAAGSTYNLFACTTVTNTPTPPACQIATMQLTANSSGMASGTVTFNLANYAIAEVFAQNNANISDQSSFIFNGVASSAGYVAPVLTTTTYPATTTTTATTTPTCNVGVLVYVNGVPTCATNTTTGTSGTCTSFSYVNGYPVCTSTSTTGTTTCTTFVFVNGTAQCAPNFFGNGFGTTLACGGYTLVNGALVCTTTGVPFNNGLGGFCVNAVLINGVPACADNGLPFAAIPGCISYSFIGNVPTCVLF